MAIVVVDCGSGGGRRRRRSMAVLAVDGRRR
jgi:hypothetical protein